MPNEIDPLNTNNDRDHEFTEHLGQPRSRKRFIIFKLSLLVIAIAGFTSYLYGYNITVHLFFIAVFTTVLFAVVKIYRDNNPGPIPKEQLAPLLICTFISWLPFGILAMGGILTIFWIDGQIDQAVHWLDAKTNDQIHSVEKYIEHEIVQSNSNWYNPFSWGKTIILKKLEATTETIVDKASLGSRMFFALLYTLLRIIQYIYYTVCALVFVKSFLFIMVHVAAWRNITRSFYLPKGTH